MALLVGAEGAPQHAGPLLVVHPADAQQVRRLGEPVGGPHRRLRPAVGTCAAPRPRTRRAPGGGRHPEARVDQCPLAPAVEREATTAGEEIVEDGQVQRRLLVRRRDAAPRARPPAAARGPSGSRGRGRRPRRRRRTPPPPRAAPATGVPAGRPSAPVLPAGARRVVPHPGPQGVKALVAPGLGADAPHRTPPIYRRALGQLVAPGDGVERAGGQDLDLVAPVRHQALGQHAGPGLGAAPDRPGRSGAPRRRPSRAPGRKRHTGGTQRPTGPGPVPRRQRPGGTRGAGPDTDVRSGDRVNRCRSTTTSSTSMPRVDELWQLFWARIPHTETGDVDHRHPLPGQRHRRRPHPSLHVPGAALPPDRRQGTVVGMAHRGHAEGVVEVHRRGPTTASEAEGWTRLEDIGDGRTRVHFSETYHAFNPLLRILLEKRVHALHLQGQRPTHPGVADQGCAVPAQGQGEGRRQACGAEPGTRRRRHR